MTDKISNWNKNLMRFYPYTVCIKSAEQSDIINLVSETVHVLQESQNTVNVKTSLRSSSSAAWGNLLKEI